MKTFIRATRFGLMFLSMSDSGASKGVGVELGEGLACAAQD
jgi:hypothetical protein